MRYKHFLIVIIYILHTYVSHKLKYRKNLNVETQIMFSIKVSSHIDLF